jgi:futalosine hydrolase
LSASVASSGSPTLLLLPTELERARFAELGGLPQGFALQATVGFGPVAAAARTAALLERLRPARAVLLGIAGAFDLDRHPLGSALELGSVALDGVGAGEGPAFLGPGELGFAQWPALPDGSPAVDRLPLAPLDPGAEPALLLTVCAASASAEERARRRARFPQAAAEDMEGFGVALACALAGVPLAVVRGVSNEVGERDKRRWRVGPALAAARALLLARLTDARPR